MGAGLAGGAASQTAARRAAAEPLLERFLLDLRRASAADDRRAVAAMIRFPITVYAGPFPVPVRDHAEFLRYYDGLITPHVRDAIERASVIAGRMIGQNVIRMDMVDGALKIVAIRLPTLDGGWRAARKDTQRVMLRAGQDVARYAGALAKSERERYLVKVRRGQMLNIRITGVKGRAVVARVVDVATGEPIDARWRDGTRTWTHPVGADADYRIEVVRLVAGGEAIMTYEMSVSLR